MFIVHKFVISEKTHSRQTSCALGTNFIEKGLGAAKISRGFQKFDFFRFLPKILLFIFYKISNFFDFFKKSPLPGNWNYAAEKRLRHKRLSQAFSQLLRAVLRVISINSSTPFHKLFNPSLASSSTLMLAFSRPPYASL